MQNSILKSALLAKSPIVAIPIPGRAPFCVKRTRLATWAKRVDITSIEVIQPPDDYYAENVPPAKGNCNWSYDCFSAWRKNVNYEPEGPHDIRLVTVTNSRYLQVKGRGMGIARIHTSAKFVPVPRHEAIKAISKWAEAERVKREKQILLGVLSKDQQRALKLMRHETEGDNAIPVAVATRDDGKDRETKQGAPIEIPELAPLRFAMVKWADDDYRITELDSGRRAGDGRTPEAALCDVRKTISKLTPEQIATTIRRTQLLAA